MNDSLDALLDNPAIWRANDPVRTTEPDTIRSDYPALDAALPGGGWPRGALTEILYEHSGIGELRLLMPALARLSQQGGWIALIAPPHIPYAPALRRYGIDLSRVLLIHPHDRTDSLWAVEQALRSGNCSAVLAWPRRIDDRSLRRLQLAAETGNTLGVLCRETTAGSQPSPAALRLRLTRQQGTTAQAHILKCRGGTRSEALAIDLDQAPVATAATDKKASNKPQRPASQPSDDQPSTDTARKQKRNRGSRQRGEQMDLPLAPDPSTTPAPTERAGHRPEANGRRH